MKTLNCNGKILNLSIPKIMGIINLAPDSFYSGSRNQDRKAVLIKATQMIDEGADILDIGAVSTRPFADNVSLDEEKQRIQNVIFEIRKTFPKIILSLDTSKPDIMKIGIDEFGFDMINDVSAAIFDSDIIHKIVRNNIAYVAMHMKGNPKSMQLNPQYKNVNLELLEYFKNIVSKAHKYQLNNLILDPGFGFGKTMADNYSILNNLSNFRILDFPLLVGISRKSMIYKALNLTTEEALNGTSALHMIAVLKGANILRVHDVKEAVEVRKLWQKLGANTELL